MMQTAGHFRQTIAGIDGAKNFPERRVSEIPPSDAPPQGPIAKILSDMPSDITVNLPRKGDILYFQGDLPSHLYVISFGTLVTILESPSGDPVAWEILGPFDTVGAFALLMGFPYPATCRADTPTQVRGYLRDRVWGRLEKDRTFRETLMHEMGDRFQVFLSRLLFAQKSVESRVSVSLLSLALKEDSVHGQTSQPVLKVTRSILASLSLTTVESAIRVTKKWEAQGLLDLRSPGWIRVLNRKALEDISGKG